MPLARLIISKTFVMYLPIAAHLLVASTYGITVGIISDMHTNLQYDSNIDASEHCWSSGTTLASDPSVWARYGCDPSPDLVDAMLRRFTETFG